MAPIYLPDGSEVGEIVLPDGTNASEVVGPDGQTLASFGPFLIAVGGDGPQATAESWVGSSWTALSDMPTARQHLAAGKGPNGHLIAIGGEDSSGNPVATAEAWDGSQWQSLPDMPTARRYLAAGSF